MNAGSSGAITQSAYWGLAHPWSGAVSYKALACVMAVLLIAIYFAHDGVRLAREHVGT